VEHLPVSTVAIVSQLVPALIFVMAYFLLGEILTRFNIVALLLGLSAALMNVLGAQSEEGDIAEKSPWLYVALGAGPVLMAFGEVELRRMRKLPVSTMLCYLSAAALTWPVVMMYIREESFGFFADLDLTSTLLVSSQGVANMLAMLFKYLAYQNQEASKL